MKPYLVYTAPNFRRLNFEQGDVSCQFCRYFFKRDYYCGKHDIRFYDALYPPIKRQKNRTCDDWAPIIES